MLTIIVTTVLAVLYGLAWHNQPAKKRESNHRSDT
jgi:hypothetical protein